MITIFTVIAVLVLLYVAVRAAIFKWYYLVHPEWDDLHIGLTANFWPLLLGVYVLSIVLSPFILLYKAFKHE